MYWKNQQGVIVEAYEVAGIGYVQDDCYLMLVGRNPMPISENIVESMEIEVKNFVLIGQPDVQATETFNPFIEVWEHEEFLNAHRFVGVHQSRALH